MTGSDHRFAIFKSRAETIALADQQYLVRPLRTLASSDGRTDGMHTDEQISLSGGAGSGSR